MNPLPITEVVHRTLVPLIVTYMPAVVTVLVAWITLVQFNLGKKHSKAVMKRSETPVKKVDRKQIAAPPNETRKEEEAFEKWGPDPNEWLREVGDSVLKMEYKCKGKFIPPCGDDDSGSTSGSCSSSESNKENSSPGRLSRRQKKNRGRKEDSSPSKKKSKKEGRKKGRHEEPFPLKQYTKLNMSDLEVFENLKNYVLTAEDMMALGYPVESKLYPGRAMIFKTGPLDANAKEFVPRGDSIHSSLLVLGAERFDKSEPASRKKEESKTEVKKCVRCEKSFFISSDGEYLTQEHCTYHWGKVSRPPSGGSGCSYTCCRGRPGSKGCSTAKLHVWVGVEPGTNGPFDGYVRTKPRKSPPKSGNHGVYALDCEMCFTNSGLELSKISVAAINGKPVYESLVRPEGSIIDYNTRFSGITAKDMSRTSKLKSLKDVQNDLMGFITADTILVGHALENDLRALRMIHYSVVDTSVVFPHVFGLPFRRSLKSLALAYLRKEIQVGPHDSYEDACSCLELVLWKVRKDLL